MKIAAGKGKNLQALVLPFWQEGKGAQAACSLGEWQAAAEVPIRMGDFTGKEGQVSVVYSSGKHPLRLVLLGLGQRDKVKLDTWRKAYGQAAKACQKAKAEKVGVLLPDGQQEVGAIVEGIASVNYVFHSLKAESLKEDSASLVRELFLLGASKAQVKQAEETMHVMEGVYLARDLINGNADDVTPQHLAAVAKDLAKKLPKVKATVFDKTRIQKEKMGLLLAVARGGPHEPVFIILTYQGAPRSKDHTVVVGKGVTFDTGGLNLKPTGGIETMKRDMSGAAAALGALYAVAKTGLKKNLTIVVPSTENSVDAHAYKPGDVYSSYHGKTVEIGNTDAEGRLILADALAYVEKKLKPTRIIDLATLTGAMVIALGHEVSGLMANDDQLAKELYEAGEASAERVWRLPLYEEYQEALKSDIADVKSTGGRPAGSITAAMFLKGFVGEVPWAHLDIAGTAYTAADRGYVPKNASGVGVRLLHQFLRALN